MTEETGETIVTNERGLDNSDNSDNTDNRDNSDSIHTIKHVTSDDIIMMFAITKINID